MSEHLIAARAALAELIADHQAHIDRARAALAALDGDAVPMVRPAPTPDVIDAPVVLPKPPQREQRPAATRSEAMLAAAAVRVTCPECGGEFSQLGITTHRQKKHGLDVPETTTQRVGDKVVRVPIDEVESSPAELALAGATAVVYRCTSCGDEFGERRGLSAHTIGAHRRGPLPVENAGVAA